VVAQITLIVVANEIEAEMLCGELRANGIACSHRATGSFAQGFGSEVTSAVWGAGAPAEVLVEEKHLERARKLLPDNR
jgi:hypothetical protein